MKVIPISIVLCIQDDVDANAAFQEIGDRIGRGGRAVLGLAHLEVAMHDSRVVPTPDGPEPFADQAEAWLRTQGPYVLTHLNNRPPQEYTDFSASGKPLAPPGAAVP